MSFDIFHLIIKKLVEKKLLKNLRRFESFKVRMKKVLRNFNIEYIFWNFFNLNDLYSFMPYF